MYVHCSTVYNSKDLEPTQMPIDDRLDRENVAHIHHGILCSYKKNDEFVSFVGTWMNLETIILSKLIQENQTLHVLTHRRVLNNENTWTQGGEHHILRSVGEGIWGRVGGMGSWGEIMRHGERCQI